jgi:hypothetical protein
MPVAAATAYRGTEDAMTVCIEGRQVCAKYGHMVDQCNRSSQVDDGIPSAFQRVKLAAKKENFWLRYPKEDIE